MLALSWDAVQGNTLAYGTSDHSLNFLDTRVRKPQHTNAGNNINSLSWARNSPFFVSSHDTCVRLWDFRHSVWTLTHTRLIQSKPSLTMNKSSRLLWRPSTCWWAFLHASSSTTQGRKRRAKHVISSKKLLRLSSALFALRSNWDMYLQPEPASSLLVPPLSLKRLSRAPMAMSRAHSRSTPSTPLLQSSFYARWSCLLLPRLASSS